MSCSLSKWVGLNGLTVLVHGCGACLMGVVEDKCDCTHLFTAPDVDEQKVG